MEIQKPDYKNIYLDIISKKFPEKELLAKEIIKKQNFTVLDVIEINKKIFNETNQSNIKMNQRLRSYSKSDIAIILDFQKKNRLNNTQLAAHFKLSRNTVTKWKKIIL